MAYIKHTVAKGDTLLGLAQEYLKDASRWIEIAELNNLDYPFIVDENRSDNMPETVKALGEVIVIHAEERLDNLPLYKRVDGYDRLLGEDLDLFGDDKYFDLTTGFAGELRNNKKGDLATVRGVNNLRQALIMRLMTPEGQLLHHPEYGSRIQQLVGQRGSEGFLQKLRVEIGRTLRGDGRVSDINIENLVIEGDRVYVSLTVSVINLDDIIQLGFTINEKGVIEWA